MSLYEHPARRLEFALAGALLVLLLQAGLVSGLLQQAAQQLRAQAPLLDSIVSEALCALLRDVLAAAALGG